ncbi:MAG TPA: hypothetical protein PLJ16_10325 [Casimicrobium huifangae]|nr:MAG: hypothetical protein EKK71_12435 [Candidatus Competibacteraceae bacterium]HQD65613.1 hypothetical protein [Casimicrobium huifangae]
MTKVRVFADTNVILESFRTGCWTAICTHFAIETVEKCVEETLTGNPGDPRHIAVPAAALSAGLSAKHPVTRKELAALVLNYPSCTTLDDGEKHLFAWLHASKLLPSDLIVVTTADKAALVASNGLGWLNCMISLEALARQAGVARVNLGALALQYREDWLSSIKTKIRLGVIP